jgi:hypothetical protein
VDFGESLCVGYFDYGKLSNRDFEFFITAQNNSVGTAGQKINIHYVCMANRFLLTGLWERKIMGKVRRNHNLCGNCPSNKKTEIRLKTTH